MPTWPEAGWYFEPGGPQIARWWDGSAWGLYAPPTVPTSPPAIDRFGMPAVPPAPQYPAGQQVALMDPTAQPWMVPPYGSSATAPKSRTGLILFVSALAVVLVLLILFVPAITVYSRQQQRAQSAASSQTGPDVPPVSPGHPLFSLASPPPQGFQGDAKVFTAAGVGALTTPTFILHGGVVSRTMTQNEDGVSFYLVPVDGSPPTPTDGSLQRRLRVRGVGSPVSTLAGTYRLVVQTGHKVSWTFDLRETFVAPLSLTVSEANSGTQVQAHGMGSHRTRVFTLKSGASSKGIVRLSGELRVGQVTTFYLEPEGAVFDPVRDTQQRAEAGYNGSFTRDLPQPGRYYLVVRTSGPWSLQFTAS